MIQGHIKNVIQIVENRIVYRTTVMLFNGWNET